MAEPSDPFELAIDALMAREFEESPLMAAALGRDGFDHRLDDCTAAGFERRAADDRLWLQRFSDMDPHALTSEQVIDRALVMATLDRRVALTGWEEWRRSPEGYLETGITELFLLAIRTEDELTEAAVARLNGIGSVLDEAAENLDPSLASRLIVERSLAQCVANIGFARNDVCQLASGPGHQDRLRAAGEVGARAYEKFAQFLRGFAPTCTGSYEFGEDRYNDVLRRGELLDTDVRALRQQGWEEYHEVAGEMATVAARIADGSTDWAAVVRRLQQVHPPSISDMRDGYEAVCLEARRFMVDHHLVTNPADEHCIVMPAPVAVRATLAVASYMAPPMFKPSKDGHFFVPYPVDDGDLEEVNGLLESNAPYSMATTAVHEAYPGHHWHLMTMKGARAIRRIFTSTYFVEGWALYTEGMMRDAGFFTLTQELGQLEARLFRAARIVVDTSLHTGEMTFDEAVAFMHDRASVPIPTARSEVARYCAWPTQASAYLTGAMAIEQTRDEWLAAGGSLQGFHDALGGSGAMPVPLAVRSIGQPGPNR
ncbi:MAG: DUF885 domain-containing protein [Acidimicrobiales bacterium]|nr:DUF885 domain-containing protein [Acidimicrobiales bacterium]